DNSSETAPVESSGQSRQPYRPARRAAAPGNNLGAPAAAGRGTQVIPATSPLGWWWRLLRWRLLRVVPTGFLRWLSGLWEPTARRVLPTRWRALRRLTRLRRRWPGLTRLRHPTTRRELPTRWRALRRLTRLRRRWP